MRVIPPSWWLALGIPYARHLVRSGLDGVYVSGLDALRTALAQGPVLLASNHTAWWDGPLAVVINHALGAHARILVDAQGLANHPFFELFGAIALDRTTPLSARHGLRQAAQHLSDPGRLVWVFPQGDQQPATQGVLIFQNGYRLIHRWGTGVRLVPVAIDYGFASSPKPSAYVHIGTPCPCDQLAQAMGQGLASIRQAMSGDGSTWYRVIAPYRTPDWPRASWAAVYRLLSGDPCNR